MFRFVFQLLHPCYLGVLPKVPRRPCLLVAIQILLHQINRIKRSQRRSLTPRILLLLSIIKLHPSANPAPLPLLQKQTQGTKQTHTLRAFLILFAAAISTSGSNSLNNSSYRSTFLPSVPNCFCSRTRFTSKNVHVIFCSTHCRHMGLLPSHLIFRLRQGSHARAERCRRYVALSPPVRGIATLAPRGWV